MKYVTVAMLCKHAGKHRSSVLRAMRQAGVPVEKLPGCRGGRIAEREANKFLLRQWPEIGPLPVTPRT